MSEALVLGGGGVGGIAWITGLLAGLADSGEPLGGFDVTIGTSAGATVAAQLGSGLDLEQLYARQVVPALQAPEINAEVDLKSFAERAQSLSDGAPAIIDVRRAAGALALSSSTVTEAERRAVIESRLPAHEWPCGVVKIVALDAESGLARIFDRASGVSIVDAVTASCAVPGIWPAATIDGRRYIDGGVRSSANADYAAGASRVLVIVPLGTSELFPTDVPLEQVAQELRKGGAVVNVLAPDERSRRAIGVNPLDPATRRAAAEAGRAQGRRRELDWIGARAAAPVRGQARPGRRP